MYSLLAITTFLAAALSSTAAAAPVRRDSSDGIYHGVGLALITSPPGQPKVSSPAPVEINVLTNLNDFSAYTIEFQTVHANVDITQVECRAYKDASGQIPGSAPFNYKNPAHLSTNEVEVGSVLCYIVTEEEAAGF